MWKNLKPAINQLVLFSIKNHWFILVFLAFSQYFTAKFRFFYWHVLGGKLFLVAAILLTGEKFYLYLIKKGKI